MEIPTPAGPPIKANEYYRAHPEHVLGTLNYGSGTTFGRAGMIVDRPADLMTRLDRLPELLPEGIYRSQPDSRVNYVTNNPAGGYLAPLHEIVTYANRDYKRPFLSRCRVLLGS